MNISLMKKKVNVVIGSLDVGGAERHLVGVLPKLVASGWVVEVLTLTRKGILAPQVENQGIVVTNLLSSCYSKFFEKLPRFIGRCLRIFLTIIILAKRLRQEKDTIVHFFLPESYVLGMFAALFSQFSGPKIMSRRSLNLYQRKRLGMAWIESKLHQKVTAVLGNSMAVLNELEKEGVPLEHLRLIYNGVELDSFSLVKPRSLVRKELGISSEALVMIIVANLIYYKGHADLFEALASMHKQLPKEWALICVGRDDGIGHSLKDKAEQSGVSQNIFWLDSRSDIPDLLSCADIGILCSHQEGFSNAVLEGMAAGLPMVVTDVGGNKEAVIDGVTGYVVPPKNPNALATAVLALVNEPDQLKAFGEKGKKRVQEHFSLKMCVKSYLDLYESLLNQHECPLPMTTGFEQWFQEKYS